MGRNRPELSNTPESEFSDDVRFFRTEIHGLSVVIGDPEEGEVAPQMLRFEPYWVEMKGRAGRIKMGYLKTDDGTAIKKLSSDANVVEISESEYTEAIEYHEDESGKPYAGIRAPY